MESASAIAEITAAPRDEFTQTNWYAVYTCVRHEKRVAEQMEQRQLPTFLPLYRAMHRWKDRRKEVELALFPGYVFVHLALQHRLRVLEIPSVVHLVSFQGRPAPLPEHEIEKLRQGVSGRVRMEPHPYLVPRYGMATAVYVYVFGALVYLAFVLASGKLPQEQHDGRPVAAFDGTSC